MIKQLFQDEYRVSEKFIKFCPSAHFVGGVSRYLCECKKPTECQGVLKTDKEKPIQKVIYRMFNCEVLALLPCQRVNYGNIAFYAHDGQHGEADSNITRAGRLATPSEYAPLHRELMRIYDDHELIIYKRVQHSDLLKGWKR